MVKLSFYGGARSVTGANYLLDVGTLKILVDCGLFQGSRFSEEYNYQPFGYNPAEVDYVLVTHSHADHMGRLPKLFKDGFKGAVIATEPTRGIIEVALPDTLERIAQEAREDGHAPLYKKEHVQQLMQSFRGAAYEELLVLNEKVTMQFHEAGHILGSASIEVIIIGDDGRLMRLVFSGDLGNSPNPMLKSLQYVPGANYVVVESAYGNRLHEDVSERQDILERTIAETIVNGGTLMIPSFAIERTQEILLELDGLFNDRKIPSIPVFLDSPLAIAITRVYDKFTSHLKPIVSEALRQHGGLFSFPWLKFTGSTEQSKQINDVPSPKIIIAGSGMSQGGRILHHELRYLQSSKNTILFVGYQVKGSLGRRILDGDKVVSILGQEVPVRCRVRAIGAYSSHADSAGLARFVAEAGSGGALRGVFVVQGEEEGAQGLADVLRERLGVRVEVPEAGQAFELT